MKKGKLERRAVAIFRPWVADAKVVVLVIAVAVVPAASVAVLAAVHVVVDVVVHVVVHAAVLQVAGRPRRPRCRSKHLPKLFALPLTRAMHNRGHLLPCRALRGHCPRRLRLRQCFGKSKPQCLGAAPKWHHENQPTQGPPPFRCTKAENSRKRMRRRLPRRTAVVLAQQGARRRRRWRRWRWRRLLSRSLFLSLQRHLHEHHLCLRPGKRRRLFRSTGACPCRKQPTMDIAPGLWAHWKNVARLRLNWRS